MLQGAARERYRYRSVNRSTASDGRSSDGGDDAVTRRGRGWQAGRSPTSLDALRRLRPPQRARGGRVDALVAILPADPVAG